MHRFSLRTPHFQRTSSDCQHIQRNYYLRFFRLTANRLSRIPHLYDDNLTRFSQFNRLGVCVCMCVCTGLNDDQRPTAYMNRTSVFGPVSFWYKNASRMFEEFETLCGVRGGNMFFFALKIRRSI